MQRPCPELVQPYPELTRHGANPEVTRAETGKATLDEPLVTFRAPLLTVTGEASPAQRWALRRREGQTVLPWAHAHRSTASRLPGSQVWPCPDVWSVRVSRAAPLLAVPSPPPLGRQPLRQPASSHEISRATGGRRLGC